MREKSPISALLRQVRAWQKAVLGQMSDRVSNGSNSLEPLRVSRHLILILFVLRLLEQRQGWVSGGALVQQYNSGQLPNELTHKELQAESLADLQQGQHIYPRLVHLWRSIQPHFTGTPISLELPPELPLTDQLLRSIIRYLYRAENGFENDDFENNASENGASENGAEKLAGQSSGHEPKQKLGYAGEYSANLLGQIYETLLANPIADKADQTENHRSARKSQGIYYTPAPIVKFIVQQTIDRLLESPETSEQTAVEQLPRLLDPACGGGAFLLEAYQRLLEWQLQRLTAHTPIKQAGLVRDKSGQWRLDWTMRQQILQHCIYGVDLDPEAVTIAQISLWLKLLEGTANPLLPRLPNLAANLRVGNALLSEDAASLKPEEFAPSSFSEPRWHNPQQNHADENLLNWEQAFPAVMRSGGFDGVIGNPPYLDSEQMTLSCPTWRPYCATRYETAIGNWDLFCVFVEKALRLCRSGGITSLIVPNKLASAPYAAKTRSLLMRHRLLFIRDYAQVPLFAASVYPLVYGVQKAQPLQNLVPCEMRYEVPYEVMNNLTDIRRSGWLSQNSASPEACWQFTESATHAQLIQRLQQFPTLGSIAQVYGAATVGEAYQLQPWLQECEMPTSGDFCKDFRFVNSGTIDRYTLLWGKKPTRYLGQTYQYPVLKGDRLHYLPVRRQRQAQQPKIIVAGLSQQLECILDEAGNLLPGKSTCVVLDLPEAIDWRYLLALLNSRLLTAYLRDCIGGNQLQGGYLRIGTAQLKQIPIALPDFTQAVDRQRYAEIIDLVKSKSPIHNSRMTDLSGHLISSQVEINLQADLQIEKRIAYLYQLTDEEESVITHTSIQQGQ